MAPPSDDEWLRMIDSSPHLSKKSKASYKKHARGFARLCGCDSLCSISHILFNFDTAYPKIARLPSNLQRSHLIVALCLFKRGEENRLFRRCDSHVSEHYHKWLEAHSKCQSDHRRRLDDNLPSEREIESAATLEEWRAAHREMQEREPGSQAALLIAFQTLALPPLRGNDLSHVRIGEQMSGNCIFVYPDGSGQLVIRDHKTSRHFPSLQRHLPPELIKMLERSVKQQPRNWLFSTAKGGAFSGQGFLQWKTGVFRRAFHGRPVTSNSLRHAYITEKVAGVPMSTNEARSIASAMGHNLGIQRQYIRLHLRER